MRTLLLTSLSILLIAGLSTSGQDQEPSERPWKQIATLDNKEINESSGLVRSKTHAACYWTHNDSGDKPRIFLINRRGESLCVCNLKGARAIDWEDIAGCVLDQKPYLLMGDIGGNAQRRKSVELYLVEEPKIDESSLPTESSGSKPTPKTIEVSALSTMVVGIPGGVTDFESMAIDESSRSVLLVEKHLLGGRVFIVPLDTTPGVHRVEAAQIGSISVSFATSCDISSDGGRLAIVCYTAIYLFDREKKEDGTWQPWYEALKKAPKPFKIPKLTQPEAICFREDGKAVILTSERLPTPLIELELPEIGSK